MDPGSIFNLAFVLLGFGFVIFWHELGHFLAAKWAGVRVDQFAVGFGQALVSFRKGLGVRVGTSGPEYQQVLQTDPARAAALSPTEYRLNWIPLGGYVKMYGQEDLVASDRSGDKDHYMAKTVGQRMVIISAGVVMNVILAAILFTALFFYGFNSNAPVAGRVVPGGPADVAGLRTGDTILSINGNVKHDFKDVSLAVALLTPGEEAVVVVRRAGTDEREKLRIRPSVDAGGLPGMLGMGIAPSPRLAGPPEGRLPTSEVQGIRPLVSPDALAVMPGDVVVAIDGRRLDRPDESRVADRDAGNFFRLDRAVREAGFAGRDVTLTVRDADGVEQDRAVTPRFDIPPRNTGGFAGLQPLVRVEQVNRNSNVAPTGDDGRPVLLPGDVIERLAVRETGASVSLPAFPQLSQWLGSAGEAGRNIDLTVRRDGQSVVLEDVSLIRIGGETRWGLGFVPSPADEDLRVGDVAPDSPAGRAGVLPGDVITSIDGRQAENWRQLHGVLRPAADGGARVELRVTRGDTTHAFELTFDKASTRQLAAVGFASPLIFVDFSASPLQWTRQTRNPLTAMAWGVGETRKQIVDLYVTLRRVLFDHTVSPTNLTGPVGIIHFGGRVAQQGFDWTLWFLAMISANLAVVNFLPIPILDGGHMVFLALEKVTGKPPSPRIQVAALYTGLALLVGLVLFVTYNDLQRIFL